MPADKFPGGTVGAIMSATDENQQEDVFLHCDPRMVAVNVNGDPELGSLVYDLNGENEYDAERGARLQSMMRVIKRPLGTANAIAWQLGSSGQSDTGGGYVIDDTSGGGGGFVIAQAGADAGGPLDVGDGQCKHQLGKDADGNPISSLHITTKALFRKNNAEDGPIRFEDAYEEGEDGWKPYPVHLAWTGVDWAPFVKLDIGPTPTGKPRPFPLPLPRGGAPTKVPTGEPWRPPWETKPVARPPGPPEGPQRRTFFQPRGVLNPQLPGGVVANFGGGNVSATGQGTLSQSSLETVQDIATPGVVGRAQTTDPKKKDLAHMPASDFNADEVAQAQFAGTPISGQMAAFGAQGGLAGQGTIYDEQVGASGDPWAYSKKPGKGRFYAGTVPGGFIFLPPEVQMGDHDSGFAPDTVEISDTFVLAGPGVYFGAGNFSEQTGRLLDGWAWGMDTETGDLVFSVHTGGVHSVDKLKLEKGTANILWKSGTGHWAHFRHANNGERTYTFPNFTGVVVVMESVEAAGGGAAAVNGTVGGTGPASSAFYRWAKIKLQSGVDAWVQTWR